ncbi:hypothetical protein [Pedobacter sp. L105]|uniref:hypothetical protein n=1 Tax=Pedobacter sp. L105 TaxID=1641871 RepID=UPI001C209A9C|nr:hypothetical protein [Pedobacter sp. L105]
MKLIPLLCISLLVASYGCNHPVVNHNENKVSYRAVNKVDTANLKIILNEKEFYGQFEINYNGVYKDSGDVNGLIKGDTLKGTFHYQHYGIETWHRIPISLLKKEKRLIMGVGQMEIFMNMTFFTKNIPIDYQHPKFIFEKVH